MASLGVALTVLVGVMMALLIRSRSRLTERNAATVPTRRAYLDRFWLFALQGYRTAMKSGWARGITRCAADTSAAAGFIPSSRIAPGTPGILSVLAWGLSQVGSNAVEDHPAGRFNLLIDSAIADGTLARLSENVDVWIPVYKGLGVPDPESWAVRKVALRWSLISGPGRFRPDLAWSSFPTVQPAPRHVAPPGGERRAQPRFPGQRADPAPAAVLRGPPTGDEFTLRFTETVHKCAVLQAVEQLLVNPDTTDEVLGLGLFEWFERYVPDSGGPFAESARAFWTLDILTDAAADKAYALRMCTVVAVRDALMEDPDTSDDCVAATAKRVLEGVMHPAITADVSDDFLDYMATVYSTRARLSGQPPDAWADEVLFRLNGGRERRKRDQTIVPTAIA